MNSQLLTSISGGLGRPRVMARPSGESGSGVGTGVAVGSGVSVGAAVASGVGAAVGAGV